MQRLLSDWFTDSRSPAIIPYMGGGHGKFGLLYREKLL